MNAQIQRRLDAIGEPKQMYAALGDMFVECTHREYVSTISFAVLDEGTVKFIARHLLSNGVASSVLEVMGGRGMLARCLRDEGVDVVVTDNFSSHKSQNKVTYVNVINRSAVSAVSTIPSNALLMCWPPMTKAADEALSRFAGDFFVYIGEGRSGCTATNELFDRLENEWLFVAVHDNPAYSGIDDSVTVFVRNTAQKLGVKRSTHGDLVVDPTYHTDFETKVGPEDTLLVTDTDLTVVRTESITSQTCADEMYSYMELAKKYCIYF